MSGGANTYKSLIVGHMRGGDGVRAPIKIGMHVVMCWLRWGDAPNGLQSPVVLHDPLTCRHSWCLGLQCLSWGDAMDNVRDRERALVHRRALQAGLVGAEAEASEVQTGSILELVFGEGS